MKNKNGINQTKQLYYLNKRIFLQNYPIRFLLIV